jgi:hypothetical protein
VLGLLFLLSSTLYITQAGSEVFFSRTASALLIASALFAALVLLIVSRRFERGEVPRILWALVSLSFLLDAIAEAVWLVYEIRGVEMPYPSLADLFWMLAYLPLLFTLVKLLLGYRLLGFAFSRSSLLLTALSAALITWIGLQFVLIPIITGSGNAGWARVLDVAYPALDVFLLILASLVALNLRGEQGRPWQAISACLALFAVADLAFSWLSYQGYYGVGNPVDFLYICSYLLGGLAGVFVLIPLEKLRK